MANKDKSISVCRAISTLFILICHTIQYYTFIPGSAFLGQFFNVGVYVFIIISGFLYGKRKDKVIDCKSFFISRYLKIALPVLIWEVCIIWFDDSSIYNFISVLLNVQGLKWISISIPVADGGSFMAHTWFVTIILLCYIMIPFLPRIKNGKRVFVIISLWIVSMVCSLLGINLIYFCVFISSYYFADSKYDKEYPIFIQFFIVGFSICIRLLCRSLFDGTLVYSALVVGLTQTLIGFSLFLIIRELAHYRFCSKLANNKVVDFLDSNSYYIYIVHYGIVIYAYNHLNLILATFIFLLCTFFMTLFLKKIHTLITDSLKFKKGQN